MHSRVLHLLPNIAFRGPWSVDWDGPHVLTDVIRNLFQILLHQSSTNLFVLPTLVLGSQTRTDTTSSGLQHKFFEIYHHGLALRLEVNEEFLYDGRILIPFLPFTLVESFLQVLNIIILEVSSQQFVEVFSTRKIDIPVDHFLGVLKPLLRKLVFQIFGQCSLQFV